VSEYRVLYAIVALVACLLISYRLLVLGENWFEPDWLNIPLILGAFLCGMYGFGVFLEIAMEKFG
jgi:hypothetical protein